MERIVSNKPVNIYSIKVIPATEDNKDLRAKQGVISSVRDTKSEEEKAQSKRKSPYELVHDQLKRNKPNSDDSISDVSFYDEHKSVGGGDVLGGYISNSNSNNRNENSYFLNDNSDNSNSATSIYVRRGVVGQDDFKGEYLENSDKYNTKFVKIQLLENFLKIESGPVNNNKINETSYTQFGDKKEAIDNALKQINQKISQDYQKKPEKFVFDFKETEVRVSRDFLIDPQPNTSQRSRSAPLSPVASLKKISDNYRSNESNSKADDTNELQIFTYDDYDDDSKRSNFVDDEDLTALANPYAPDKGFSRNDYLDDDELTALAYPFGILKKDQKAKSTSPSPQKGYDSNIISNSDVSLGKSVTKPFNSVLLAKSWDKATNPTGFYMSEKLDGVRCFWTGSQMFSRSGKRYFPPKFFIKDFPNSPLDGELWCGRSTFQKCVSYVRKQNPIDDEWRKVAYLVFDAPNLALPFNQRYKRMEESFNKVKSPYIKLHPHQICKGFDHLQTELTNVEDMGGEGMMLRDPKSYYEQKRSGTLLKVKNFQDEEATVLGYEGGEGRNTGVVGALIVINKDDIQFKVGSGLTDAERRHPPKIGSKITYKHQGVSDSGKPRFPTFLRIYQGD